MDNNTKIYVGNISFQAQNKDLVAFFSQYGEILEVMLIPDSQKDKHKGYGFITFSTPEEAQAALAANGLELMGRQLKVYMAKRE